MMPHHRISSLPPALEAGDHHLPPVNPHPCIGTSHKKRIAVPAELAAERAGDTEPVTHCDPPCKGDVPVTQAGILVEPECCLLEQNPDPLPCQFLCFGIDCPLGHVLLLLYKCPVHRDGAVS